MIRKENHTMSFCKYCGNRLAENASFCSKCGNPVSSVELQPSQVTSLQPQSEVSELWCYMETARELPFVGDVMIEVSAEQDRLNKYLRQFHLYVNKLMRGFQQDYRRYCSTVEGYIENFVNLNGQYAKETADEAAGLLFSHGIYSYTTQDLLEMLLDSPVFDSLSKFHENNFDLAESYLQDNYNRAVNKANRMPQQVFFGTGLGGMALSYGLSAATSAIQNRRANKMIANSQRLTPAQEREFLSIVKEADAMFLVWDELVNIGYIAYRLIAEINESFLVWPYQEDIDNATRIFENMQNPRFPQEQLVSAAKYVLEVYPYIAGLYSFLRQRFGNTPQIYRLEQYFYDPQIFLFPGVFPEYGE